MTRRTISHRVVVVVVLLVLTVVAAFAAALSTHLTTASSGPLVRGWNFATGKSPRRLKKALFSDSGKDANDWSSFEDSFSGEEEEDWEMALKRRRDGSLWSSFDPAAADDSNNSSGAGGMTTTTQSLSLEEEEDVWLNALASVSADEISFIAKEAERADKMRQMQERGYTSDQIRATLGVETDEALESSVHDNDVLEKFTLETKKSGFGMYLLDEDVDLATVESHTQVDVDDDTGEPVRSQMVYVDEHTCIGCTNCAMIAQSTFFMNSEHGRARVFRQWGDDDETIQVAIETCPVDCIHYVPYDELVTLEVERRHQNINFKARLVNQGEYGGGQGHRVGSSGTHGFTGPQKISGNLGARCANCPTRGCPNCPMYGVGRNPVYEQKEKERKQRIATKRMKEQMESNHKSVDL